MFTVTCEGAVDLGLMDLCDREWFLRLFTVYREGAVGVCLMDLLFTPTCPDAVGVGLMDQNDIGSYVCFLLPVQVY